MTPKLISLLAVYLEADTFCFTRCFFLCIVVELFLSIVSVIRGTT